MNSKGAFLFTQSAIPLLLKVAEAGDAKYPPTLIYTGATASVKSSALFSSFSAGKWAQRALALSVAREFAPKGVHVAHAIIDGIIDIPGDTKPFTQKMAKNEKISPEGVSICLIDGRAWS